MDIKTVRHTTYVKTTDIVGGTDDYRVTTVHDDHTDVFKTYIEKLEGLVWRKMKLPYNNEDDWISYNVEIAEEEHQKYIEHVLFIIENKLK